MVNRNRKPWKVDDCEGTAPVISYCMLMCTAISCLSADVLNNKYIKVQFSVLSVSTRLISFQVYSAYPVADDVLVVVAFGKEVELKYRNHYVV